MEQRGVAVLVLWPLRMRAGIILRPAGPDQPFVPAAHCQAQIVDGNNQPF